MQEMQEYMFGKKIRKSKKNVQTSLGKAWAGRESKTFLLLCSG